MRCARAPLPARAALLLPALASLATHPFRIQPMRVAHRAGRAVASAGYGGPCSVEDLEERIEACEAEGDLEGAVEGYEALLKLQPPTAPELSRAVSTRRALQELMLEAARRELEACGGKGCEVEDLSLLDQARAMGEAAVEQARAMGEASRASLAERALADVERLRSSVVSLLDESEAQAVADAERARGEQTVDRLVEGGSGWLAGFQVDEAERRASDARLLRKSIESDLNRLELQLLQGDPTLAFIRNVLSRTRQPPAPPEAGSPQSLWLEEQFATGALPRDPELLRTLLSQLRRDPEMVERLVTLAKDTSGKDVYTRRENDVSGLDKNFRY